MVDFTPLPGGSSYGTDAITAFPPSASDQMYGGFNPNDPTVSMYGASNPFDATTGAAFPTSPATPSADSLYGSFDPFGGGGGGGGLAGGSSTAGGLTGASAQGANADPSGVTSFLGGALTVGPSKAGGCSFTNIGACLPQGLFGPGDPIGPGAKGGTTCSATNWSGCFPFIGDFATRAAVVVLGFIFVAAGLFMFGRETPFVRHVVPNVLKP